MTKDSRPGQGKTVLVIEDDREMAALVRTYLEHEGYAVETVETGEQGIEVAVAQEVGAGPAKRILLVLDGAGWHTGAEVQVPEGIHLLVLPSYSPELQPAEHLWPLTNEPLANKRFPDLATLEAVQAERCNTLQLQPDLIRQHTLFH